MAAITQTAGSVSVTSNYRYDWDGRRIAQSISGSGVSASQTNYLWDETSQYGDVVLETDGSGNPQASYVLGDGELISQDKGGTTSYYLKDGHGSVRSLTDGSGNLVSGEQYTYDAFGTMVGGPINPASKYLYTGQQFDGQTGLYDLRARYYNPEDGRFLSQDSYQFDPASPIELNRYVYTSNNPILYLDASGYTLAETIQEVLRQMERAIILYQVGQTVEDYIAEQQSTELAARAQEIAEWAKNKAKIIERNNMKFPVTISIAEGKVGGVPKIKYL